MVLTNFECWAHGGSDDAPQTNSLDGVIERRNNQGTVDLFNPNNSNNSTPIATHLSSNCYYGFVPPIASMNSSDDCVNSFIGGGGNNNNNNNNNNNSDNKIIIGGNNNNNVAETLIGFHVNNKINNQQQINNFDDSIQMMDIEQQQQQYQNGNPSAVAAINEMQHFNNLNGSTAIINGGWSNSLPSTGCRKRCYNEENYYQMQRRNAKRSRFDHQREEYLAGEQNIGNGYPSIYAPTTSYSVMSMDYNEFVTSENSNSNNNDNIATTNNAATVDLSQPNNNNKTRPFVNRAIICMDSTNIENRQLIECPQMKVPKISQITEFSQHSIISSYENKLNNYNMISTPSTTLTIDQFNINNCNNIYNICDYRPTTFVENETDYDQLDELFLNIHGGGDHYLWRHLIDNLCDDI